MIEVSNIEKTYISESVQTPALRGVSLRIEKGEFVAIMGPSGSGKSTLLHILGFLDRPTKGTYKLDGKTIADFTQNELARIRNSQMGFVFQAFNLLPRTNVFDNVKLPLLYSQTPEAEWNELVTNAIESVGLSHRISHSPAQLSIGEKQRVAIARALVNKPQLIFADEPTGNLDSKSGNTVMEILQALNKEKGYTIVVITHEETTARFAKRLITCKDGIIESDHAIKA
jgi:putative ABC transport system ATP-binding protein